LNDKSIIVENITKTFQISKPKGVGNIIKNQLGTKKSKKFLKVLDGISFSVSKGEVLGIIGLNGSGKTTLLRVIAGLYKPDHGSVVVNGKISPLMQLGVGFQGDLDAKDNVILNGLLLGMKKTEMENKVESIIKWAGIEEFPDLKLKHYSSGMRVRLAFSIAIQVKSDILLLDEVLAVGDRIFREKSYEAILSFKKNNKTILHTTHNLKSIEEFTDRALLLHHGKMLMIGEPQEVIKKYQEITSNKN